MSDITKEKHHDLIEQTQIESWENEGGAHANIARPFSRCRDIAMTSYLTSHISTAECEIESGNYEVACDELEAAASR